MINKIASICRDIKNNRSIPSILCAITEEVGELAMEVRVKHMPDCYKEGDIDGILGEGCDVLISTLDLLISSGYNEEEISKKLEEKIKKWQEKTKGENNGNN